MIMSKHPIDIELPILAEMSRNILEWRATSLLPEGAELHRYAKNIRHSGQFGEGELLRRAEDEAAQAAMSFVIRYVDEIDNKLQIPAAEGLEGSAAHIAYELRSSISLMAKTATVRADIWQRCATAALRAATLLEAVPLASTESEPSEASSSPKSDQEIVDEVNALAGLLLRQQGYEAPEGHLFYLSDNARAQVAWERAVEAYELVTSTEVHDALQNVLPEED